MTGATSTRPPPTPTGPEVGSVDLWWIPLGAGGRSVRLNGVVYEALAASLQHRPRRRLFHSVLEIRLPEGAFMVEVAPVPSGDGHQRGVVASGPVGVAAAGRVRLFRYEVRRWRDGTVPDLGFAVGSPIQVAGDVSVARAVHDALPKVPTLTWGRDEFGAGEMWSCNSITSWALTCAGIDVRAVALPEGGRAPGWDAGVRVATARHPVPAAP